MASTTTTERELKAARNQMLFRSVNDRIKELGEDVLNPLAEVDFSCECADPSCVTPIVMPLGEFAAIEELDNRFVVLPGHEDLSVEDVTDQHDGYLIVAKRGAGGDYVRRHSNGG